MNNRILDLLIDLGLSTKDSVHPFHPRVRDRRNVSALCCDQCGAILLNRTDHLEGSHYRDQDGFAYWQAGNRKKALAAGRADDERRARRFAVYIRDRHWLDVGTGAGGLLDLLGNDSSSVTAVEPQGHVRRALREQGYRVEASIRDLPEEPRFEVVTLFHVLEHLVEPVATLQQIRRRMRANGTIIVEVPHAGDALLSLYQPVAFRDFTLWSEHLLLHTRRTLERFLRASGYEAITIQGIQRYPLANHLYWLSRHRPGGHDQWSFLRDQVLDHAYGDLLASLDMTDTLVCEARNCISSQGK